MAFITQFWEVVTSVVNGGVTLLTTLFNALLTLFWSETGFTTFGAILLISVATPLIIWGLNWVIGLVRSIRITRGSKR